jgi:hypothetical protein
VNQKGERFGRRFHHSFSMDTQKIVKGNSTDPKVIVQRTWESRSSRGAIIAGMK